MLTAIIPTLNRPVDLLKAVNSVEDLRSENPSFNN